MSHSDHSPVVELRFSIIDPPVSVYLSGLSFDTLRIVAGAWTADLAASNFAATDTDIEVVCGNRGTDELVESTAVVSSPGTTPRWVVGTDGDHLIYPHCRVEVPLAKNPIRVVTEASDPRDLQVLPHILESALGLAFARKDAVVLHAAAFRVGDRAVVALGESKGGKSTVSALALRLGGCVVSDDSIITRPGREHSVFASLRSSLVFRGQTRSLLPARIQRILEPIHEPAALAWRLSRANSPESFCDRIHADRLWTLSIDRRLNTTRIVPMTQAECISSLISAGPSLVLSPRYSDHRTRLMPILIRIAETTPSFRVRLGRDTFTDPEGLLRTLLEA